MFRLLAIVAAVLLSFSGPTKAAIVAGTFSGTIAGNTLDTYGLFGPAGTDLSGKTLSAAYSYDTAAAFSYDVQSAGDSYFGSNDLVLSATIDGATVATAGVTESEVTDARNGTTTAITLIDYAPTPLLKFALIAMGTWTADVTINAPFLLDPSWDQQTIYVSADGSHYDQLTFVANDDPPVSADEPWTVALATMALAELAVVRRRRVSIGPNRV